MPPKNKKKQPFSNKQKKIQLQQKREKKKGKVPFGDSPPPPSASKLQKDSNSESDEEEEKQPLKQSSVSKLHHQPLGATAASGHYNPNRFRLHFQQDSKEEIERRKFEAKTVPLVRIEEVQLEVGVEDVYHPGTVLDIPKRPPWDYSMSKTKVEKQEEEMFEQYLHNIYDTYSKEDLSYFELNLETWRQLWRVLEISDIVLLITDVRHPALHFSPALYNYVVQDLKKQIVLVLNKIDLVPPQVVVSWKHYFTNKFPHLDVICFTSFPNYQISLERIRKVKLRMRRKGKLLSAVGPRELFRVIESLYKGKLDLSPWQQKLDSDVQDVLDEEEEEEEDDDDDIVAPVISKVTSTGSPLDIHNVKEGIITIGLLGHPNVGKSSILNGVMGKKFVSTSRTPGHTKHFQTIFLTPNIQLCDCPGLVFPSLINKQLQILSGMYPISQVQEPYTAVGYLAQRVPILQLLSLSHPDPTVHKTEPRSWSAGGLEENITVKNEMDVLDKISSGGDSLTCDGEEWTAWDICDAWATRRGFYTKKGARLDTYRAANDLLRLAADGRISLYFRPPGFSREKVHWDTHPDVKEIIHLQQQGLLLDSVHHSEESEESEESEGGEGGEGGGGVLDLTEQTKFSMLMNLDDTEDNS